MKHNLVIILIIITFNLFYANGKPEHDSKPQYVPKYLKDSYDWANSHRNKRESGVQAGGAYHGGCTRPPTVHNAQTKCSSYSGCRSSCVENYQFRNGQTMLFITCAEGKWEVDGTEWETIPSCEPICSPACLNNGICTAPNFCNCPENYSGPQCQIKMCITFPPIPMNSARKCSHRSCTVTCMTGHQFSDGSTIANMVCSNGTWVPAKSEWSQIPDCEGILL